MFWAPSVAFAQNVCVFRNRFFVIYFLVELKEVVHVPQMHFACSHPLAMKFSFVAPTCSCCPWSIPRAEARAVTLTWVPHAPYMPDHMSLLVLNPAVHLLSPVLPLCVLRAGRSGQGEASLHQLNAAVLTGLVNIVLGSV